MTYGLRRTEGAKAGMPEPDLRPAWNRVEAKTSAWRTPKVKEMAEFMQAVDFGEGELETSTQFRGVRAGSLCFFSASAPSLRPLPLPPHSSCCPAAPPCSWACLIKAALLPFLNHNSG
jgi:hypothetical protein